MSMYTRILQGFEAILAIKILYFKLLSYKSLVFVKLNYFINRILQEKK